MRRSEEAREGKQKGGALKERLRGVRKRKQGWQARDCVDRFACGVVAYKLELVEDQQGRDRGR